MNKRILLAWELGGGRGHAYILGWVAKALRQRGYEPILAVQQLETLEPIKVYLDGATCLQAPRWPGFAHNRTPSTSGRPVTLGDILADLGLRSPVEMRQVLSAWDGLLELTKPAAVVADYAPGALLVANGRCPTIAVGDGFTLPPATMAKFPTIVETVQLPKYDEQGLVDTVNECLRNLSRSALSRLPQVFAADRCCVGSFAEFDLYREHRQTPNTGPWLPHWNRSVETETNEIFGYFSIPSPMQPTLVKALKLIVEQGITVRVHMPQLGAKAISLLDEIGVIAERSPIPFEEIQRRSRLVMSLGSLSFVASSLVAGIPQIVLPTNLSFHRAGSVITEIGVGRSLNVKGESPLEPALLAQAIIEIFNDANFLRRAREVAPDFARRLNPRPEEVVAGYVEELVGSA